MTYVLLSLTYICMKNYFLQWCTEIDRDYFFTHSKYVHTLKILPIFSRLFTQFSYLLLPGIKNLVGKRDKIEFAQTVIRYDRKFKVCDISYPKWVQCRIMTKDFFFNIIYIFAIFDDYLKFHSAFVPLHFKSHQIWQKKPHSCCTQTHYPMALQNP